MPNVKLCCIASIAEAELAISSAATALGLVSAMPSGPGVIDERQIATIAAHVATTAPSIRTFLLTAKT
ncbi:MAG: phosphoribosylanthranilate isomerase, partial [Rhodocyclaceae bacterium]|nr:phosphoribosylanthranilate isomerase [Rhodocyclaceae bacterium]